LRFLLAADDISRWIINGCLSAHLFKGWLRFPVKSIQIPSLSWIQTPSIVEVGPGKKESLNKAPLNFSKFLFSAGKELEKPAGYH